MTLSRRSLLLGGVALVAVGTGGFLYRGAFEARIARIIDDIFGADLVPRNVIEAFTADLVAATPSERLSELSMQSAIRRMTRADDDPLTEDVALTFAQSTTVVRAAETGQAVEYIAYFDAYTAPCANTLSVNWL